MDESKFTVAEIMAAFETLKRDIDSVGGPGAGATDRFLIDDVATDVRNFLTAINPPQATALQRE